MLVNYYYVCIRTYLKNLKGPELENFNYEKKPADGGFLTVEYEAGAALVMRATSDTAAGQPHAATFPVRPRP
jgi:hypothetical protein